jgi:hypothetical protein
MKNAYWSVLVQCAWDLWSQYAVSSICSIASDKKWCGDCVGGSSRGVYEDISEFPGLDSNLWTVVYKLLTSTPQRPVCRVVRWSFGRTELYNFVFQLRYSSTWVARHPVMLRKVRDWTHVPSPPEYNTAVLVASVQSCRHCFRAWFVVPFDGHYERRSVLDLHNRLASDY